MRQDIRKVRALGLLTLPLLAVAAVVLVLSFGHSSSTEVEADSPHTGLEFSIDVDGVTGCTTNAGPGDQDVKCEIDANSTFTLNLNLDSIPGDFPDGDGDTNGGYSGYDAAILYTGDVTSKDNADINQWPDCTFGAPSFSAGQVLVGCAIGVGANGSTFTGTLATNDFNCGSASTSGTIQLLHGGANGNTQLTDENGTQHDEGKDFTETLTINCVPPPSPTPTNTPPPVPAMSKKPALSNNFLTAQQSTKIPPASCLAGGDVTVLSEQLDQEIVTEQPSPPKPAGIPQLLQAFEFEVHYDETKSCVELVPGPEFERVGAACTIVDDQVATQNNEGVARIGCVVLGKLIDQDPPDEIDELQPLAFVNVRPQPDVYSQAKPNQDNGVTVQINNVGCDLADDQGHSIPIFSCDDADVTYRFLEGDVNADCAVDNLDTQTIAFRWGSEKGSTLYSDWMNLEPSGNQGDNDIDIADLQFVYGRFGSTCDTPHPAQDPVNPKAIP